MLILATARYSFTKGNYQQTWADFLVHALDNELVNVAARGAGIEFVLYYQDSNEN